MGCGNTKDQQSQVAAASKTGGGNQKGDDANLQKQNDPFASMKIILKPTHDLKPEDDISDDIFSKRFSAAIDKLKKKAPSAQGEDKGWQYFRLGLAHHYNLDTSESIQAFDESAKAYSAAKGNKSEEYFRSAIWKERKAFAAAQDEDSPDFEGMIRDLTDAINKIKETFGEKHALYAVSKFFLLDGHQCAQIIPA